MTLDTPPQWGGGLPLSTLAFLKSQRSPGKHAIALSKTWPSLFWAPSAHPPPRAGLGFRRPCSSQPCSASQLPEPRTRSKGRSSPLESPLRPPAPPIHLPRPMLNLVLKPAAPLNPRRATPGAKAGPQAHYCPGVFFLTAREGVRPPRVWPCR